MANRSRGRKIAIGLAVSGVVLSGIIWFVVGIWLDSWNSMVRSITREFFVRQMFPSINPLNWTPFTYAVLALIFGGLVFFARRKAEIVKAKYSSDEDQLKFVPRTTPGSRLIAICLATACALSSAYVVTGIWDNDKDEARSYADDTTFVVEDPAKLPASLSSLTEGSSANADGADCLFGTKHDVPSCVTKGTLPSDWDARSASLTGAEIVMSRTSGAVPNTEIMTDTLTYLNDGASWTAIRNGKNKVPVYGIVSWNGSDATQTCRFTGKSALNYAFEGRWGQNLDDTLAKDYPGLLYDKKDMWGYCKGGGEITSRTPVIVIPVTEQESYGRRTTLRAGGVLEITGSPSGEPVINHRKSVKAGAYPGPVYPLTLVAKQREMIQWASGRGNKNRLNFGYEPSDVAAQGGNDSEYLLRAKGTGRLFWVTPLKPRSTDSQLLVAYSLTPADEVGEGTLNEQKVYVLPDEDPRIVNVDDMEARVSEAIRNSNPGFFTGTQPGKISEFLPVSADRWQAFAELNGRVVFRVDVPSNARIAPTVQTIDNSGEEKPGTPPATSPCTKPKGELSKDQLADCIDEFARELAGRK
jgi:hypothetical protein